MKVSRSELAEAAEEITESENADLEEIFSHQGASDVVEVLKKENTDSEPEETAT